MSLKTLRATAKSAGLKNYSKLNTADLETLLAAHGVTDDTDLAPVASQGDDEEAEHFAPIGFPNEPEKGGLTEIELAPFVEVAASDEGPYTGPHPTGAVTLGVGIPTEPDKGGLNALERRQLGLT